MGRHFFGRGPARILEVGCGPGANLRLVADEGFEAWGIDQSPGYVELCRVALASRGLTATLKVADMTATGLPGSYFNAVVDIFSSCCLNDSRHAAFLDETKRLLAPGGWFFCFTPSQTTAHLQPVMFPDPFPWRFTTHAKLATDLERRGFTIGNAGTLRRPDGFEFAVVEGRHGSHAI